MAENGRKNVFVLGQDEFNEAKLSQVHGSQECEFHSLLDYYYIHSFADNPMSQIMDSARQQLKDFEGSIDGLIWLWDFPGCLMGPVLCEEFGLPTPSPASVFICENKYLSRVHQEKIIPECTPRFWGFNPAEENIVERAELQYPFWVKPVTGFSGHLGFEIKSDADFRQALAKIDKKENLFAEPYWYLEQQIDLPEDMEPASEKMFIAEQIISGKQCTLEGFVFNGEFGFEGIIDSFRYPNRMSFSRYQYPSRLPAKVQRRMYEKAQKILSYVGYDNAAFNIEFFWDRKKDKIWLLEINTRISQSHCDLFKKVDGQLSHKIPLDIALGRRPDLPKRQGDYKLAAKLFLRNFENGTVTNVPNEEQIKRLEEEFDATIYITVNEGMKLEDLKWQDSYSYVLAIVYVGSQSQKELVDKFDQCVNRLDIEVDDRKVRSKQERII